MRMTRTGSEPGRPFGRLLTAMVTPFHPDGSLDTEGAARLATHLVDDCEHDGLVINGTTGEAPTTSDAEKDAILRTVIEAVGDRARRDRRGRHQRHPPHQLSSHAPPRRPAPTGSWLSRRTTTSHRRPASCSISRAVADNCGLPMMVYDIPGRSGVAIATETMCRLAEHERIIAVKDAKGDLGETLVGSQPHRPRVLLRRGQVDAAAALGRRGRRGRRADPRVRPRDQST